jgi:hypothetical protein
MKEAERSSQGQQEKSKESRRNYSSGAQTRIDSIKAPGGNRINATGVEGPDSVPDRPIVEHIFDSAVEESGKTQDSLAVHSPAYS